MPAPLRAVVDATSMAMLSDLRIANSVPYQVRDRAHLVLMSAEGWNAPALSRHPAVMYIRFGQLSKAGIPQVYVGFGTRQVGGEKRSGSGQT